MGVRNTSLIRRLRAFPRSPRKLQKIRDSIRDIGFWARTFRSRRALRGFTGPVIAITGTNGKTTTTLLTSRIFSDAGYRVGTACSIGIYVNRDCVLPGTYTGLDGPLLAYRAGGTDVLVVETAHVGILRHGFGFPACDVAVFTNISEGHLGQLGINTMDEMLALKWNLTSRLRHGGTIVLNADDAMLASASPPPTANVSYVSIASGTPRDRARPDATLYRFADGIVVKEHEGRSETIGELSKAPLLLGGLIPYNASNLIGALAAAEAVSSVRPVPRQSLLQSLLSFGSRPTDNPGRFSLFDTPGGKVVLLAGSNKDSYRRDVEVLASIRERQPFPVERVVGVITGLWFHTEEYMRELCQLASSVCDEIVIRAPQERYLKGRRFAQIATILATAARDAGIAGERIRVHAGPFDLIQDLLRMPGQPGRLVAVFCAFAQEPILPLCGRLADLAPVNRETEEPGVERPDDRADKALDSGGSRA